MFCMSCDGRGWYEAVTSAYVCVVLLMMKGIVVDILGYCTPAITVITIIR